MLGEFNTILNSKFFASSVRKRTSGVNDIFYVRNVWDQMTVLNLKIFVLFPDTTVGGDIDLS